MFNIVKDCLKSNFTVCGLPGKYQEKNNKFCRHNKEFAEAKVKKLLPLKGGGQNGPDTQVSLNFFRETNKRRRSRGERKLSPNSSYRGVECAWMQYK